MKKPKKTVAYLNELLTLNFESEKIFLQALERVNNSVLKNFFRVSGHERNQIIRLLDSAIRQKGGVPSYPEDSFVANHKLSSNIKKIIASKNEQLLLTEIGRLKLADIEKYQKILNNYEFSEEIESSIKSQKDMLVKSLYSIEVHKDLFAKNIVSF
ncbi:MAG: PA2169 family four-helix-bundle protein [Flaviramulus sp.]|nr:PA2169 family four-helix-bundle protein [Flaviramulus sp.]